VPTSAVKLAIVTFVAVSWKPWLAVNGGRTDRGRGHDGVGAGHRGGLRRRVTVATPAASVSAVLELNAPSPPSVVNVMT
jgi:hypothetical protein